MDLQSALLRPTTDLDVALAMPGAQILEEFGADPAVETAIARILDSLAENCVTTAIAAHIDLTRRLDVLIGQRRVAVREALIEEMRDER